MNQAWWVVIGIIGYALLAWLLNRAPKRKKPAMKLSGVLHPSLHGVYKGGYNSVPKSHPTIPPFRPKVIYYNNCDTTTFLRHDIMEQGENNPNCIKCSI